MMDIFELKKISPNNIFSPLDKMPFSDFVDLAKPILPHFPEDVIDQWVYENFNVFVDQIENGAEYERLTFQLEEFEIEDILKIKDPSEYYEKGLGCHFVDGNLSTKLINYMRNHPTWPRPIIVKKEVDEVLQYDNFVLLEGHLRLTY